MFKRLLKSPSTKFRIALGQASLLVSLLLIASLLGLIPDRQEAEKKGRAALAEAIAINTSAFITRSDLRRMQTNLNFIVERNADILSAGIRKADGKLVADTGSHEQHWLTIEGGHSTLKQVQVPLWAGERQWGQVELRYTPLHTEGWLGYLTMPLVLLVGFLVLSSFILFYFYLGKMLKQLDPSQAIPDRVRSALDTMAEGLLVLDRQGYIVLANEAFAKIVEKTPTQLMGRKVGEFAWTSTEGDALDSSLAPWGISLNESTPLLNTMVRLQTSELSRRTFMVNCSPVLGANDKAGGVLISFDDVTELEEKEIELRQSKNEAEAANKAKSDFLANMSHEIRTPMNAILGFTEVLRRGYGNNEQEAKRHLNTIHSSGTHLLALINDILDLSKVEANRIEVETTQCEPYSIIHEIVQILGVKAEEKGIYLTYEPENEQPATIQSDPARIRQILTNLVGNSLKFTEQGGVTIISRLDTSTETPQMLLEIRDTGIGMSEAQQKIIFDPFVQADTSITRRFGGTGLGLSISRRFAEALGGGIEVRSKEGEGSSFIVRLDIGPLDNIPMLLPEMILSAQETRLIPKGSQWSFPNVRVLVVDDGAENRELVKVVLEETGLIVDEAEDGQVCCDMAGQQNYALILMDMQMPGMDGETATRHLRSLGVATPIFALTAHAMQGFEQECLDAGFDGVITKPVNIDLLFETLAPLLGGKVINPTTKKLTPDRGKPGTMKNPETAPIVSTLPADNPRFAAIIKRFIERLDKQIKLMENTWEKRDYPELATLAHWLKGAGGTVGFDVFTEPAKELEQYANAQNEMQTAAVIEQLRQLSKRIATSNTDENCLVEIKPIESSLPSNNPRFQAIIQRFGLRLDEQIEKLQEAYELRDYPEIASLAHWLKGAGGTVGFDVFTKPAALLEEQAKAENAQKTEELINKLRGLASRLLMPA